MTKLHWWQTAVFYQIYPRSFADGNGDGIGDIQGIIAHLDHLQALGIGAIWLSPHYPSPQFDCGYDIADYIDVEPAYGTLDEFKRFLDAAHQRDIRVILDLVLNHTSDQHRWFLQSRSSRDNPKRNWYVWRDGKNGGPPNNWPAAFDNSAWEYDSTTDQYYYHFFFKEQPDLNWRNLEVKKAMFNVVRFWLDMGVDGFRLDAIGTIFEDPDLPDHSAEITQLEMFRRFRAAYPDQPDPETAAYLSQQRELMFRHQQDQPGVHELLQELRALVDTYNDRVLVGEIDDVAYYGDGSNELHMVFNFPLMRTNRLTPAWIRANQQERLSTMPPSAWPCNTLGNHDTARVYSRYGDGQNDGQLARLSLALMLTLRGTPFLYNGEEIGMSDLLLQDINQFRDNLGVWLYRVNVEELGLPPADALAIAQNVTRDKCRTPLQWANAPDAGFSPPGALTWLPVNPNYAQGVNVTEQDANPDSLLNFYRRMLRVRQQTPALIAGDYRPLHEASLSEESEAYFAFLRQTEGQTCLVVLNFSGQAHELQLDLDWRIARHIFTYPAQTGDVDLLSQLAIRPFAIYIGELLA